QDPQQWWCEGGGVGEGLGPVGWGARWGFPRVRRGEKAPPGLPAILQALARGPPVVDPPPLLLPLPQRERILDLPRQARHDRLHLSDFVGREREQRLVGEDLARELLALTPRAAFQLPLDVLPDHPPERFQAELEIVADAG